MKTFFFVCALLGTALANPWPDLSEAPSSGSAAPNDAAVIIAIENYPFVSKIPGALANADDWYREFRTRDVPIERIALLRDAQATREEILEAVKRTAKQVKANGRLWVVFIGHGAPGPDGQPLLVGVDAQQTARSLPARGLAQADLLAATGAASQTIMILDTCFSGRDPSGQALVEGLQPLIPVKEDALAGKTMLFTAAAADQFAGPLPGARRPAFSYLLLGALRGWGDANGDGVVTATEANAYVSTALTSLVRDRRQTPQLIGAGELVADRREDGPDLDAIRLSMGRGVPQSGGGQVAGREVRIIAGVEGETFTAALTVDGIRRPCPRPIDHVTPCRLQGLTGREGKLTVSGDASATKLVPFKKDETNITLYDDSPGSTMMWIGGGLVAGGLALVLTATGEETTITEGEGSSTEGGFASGTTIGGIMALTGGFLFYYGYKSSSRANDAVHIAAFPTADGGQAAVGGRF